jgi:hypothetical protein
MWYSYFKPFRPMRKRVDAKKAARGFRPRVEILEERTVPTNQVFWDGGGGDSLWNNPLNWTGDFLPAASDIAVIRDLPQGTIITAQGNSITTGKIFSEVPLHIENYFSISDALAPELTITGGGILNFSNSLVVGQVNVNQGFLFQGGDTRLYAVGPMDINLDVIDLSYFSTPDVPSDGNVNIGLEGNYYANDFTEVWGSLINQNLLVIGDHDLTITKNYTQTTTATLQIEVQDPGVGPTGELIIEGNAELSGTLELYVYSNISNSWREFFDLVETNTRTGTFTTITGLTDNEDIFYDDFVVGVLLDRTGRAFILPDVLVGSINTDVSFDINLGGPEQIMLLTLSVSHGTLEVPVINPNTGSNFKSTIISLSGELSQLTPCLNNWVYHPDLDFQGFDAIEARLNYSRLDDSGNPISFLSLVKYHTVPIFVNPVLELTANSVQGNEGSDIPLDIQVNVLGEQVYNAPVIYFFDVPSSVTFSAGTSSSGGLWYFTISELTGLKMNALGHPDSFTIPVTTYVTAGEIITEGSPYFELTSQFSVTVNNVPLQIILQPSGPYSLVAGQNFSFQGSFTDPGEGPWQGSVTYGDSQTSFPLVLNANKTFALNHTYHNPGVYTGQITIVENGNQNRIANFQVEVGPSGTLQVTPASGSEGLNIPLNIQVSANQADEQLVLISQVPQGATLSAGVQSNPGIWQLTPQQLSGLSINGLSQPSNFNLTVQYTIKKSVGSGTFVSTVYQANLAVTVQGVLPQVTVNVPSGFSAQAGQQFNLSGFFTDPGQNVWTGTVDFGDGTGQQSLALQANKTFTLSRTYAVAGNYNVVVLINDGRGAGSTNFTVSVKPVVNVTVQPASGGEGSLIPLNIQASFTGSLGNEQIFIRQVPQDLTLSAGTFQGLGVWLLTPAQLVGLKIGPVPDGDRQFTLNVEGVASVAGNAASDVKNLQVSATNVAPLVNLGGISEVFTPVGVSWNVSGSFADPGAESWTGTVNYGDGTQPLVLQPNKTFQLSHSYAVAGNYAVLVTISDANGGQGTVSLQAHVKPVVSLTVSPATANEGSELPLDIRPIFQGSLGGEQIFIRNVPANLTLSAGTFQGAGVWLLTPGQLNGLKINTLSQDSSFSLTVEAVATVAGNSASDTKALLVTVNNVLPQVVVNVPGNLMAQAGSSFSLSGSFLDPGADVWTATVDYGDGTGSQALPLQANKTFTLGHTYAVAGNYTVLVQINDGSGQGSRSFTIPVKPVVNVTVQPATGGEGSLIPLNIQASFTGSLGNEQIFIRQVPQGISLSAGTFQGQGIWLLTPTQLSGLKIGPVPDGDRQFTLSVEGVATVAGNAASDIKDLPVLVNNVAPLAFLDEGQNLETQVGQPILLTGQFTDPGADSWTATVNFGDGSGDMVLVLQENKSFALEHGYPQSGTFEVMVRVTDNAGEQGQVSFSLAVFPKVTVEVSPASAEEGSPIPLDIQVETEGETGVEQIIIRNVPQGVTLSAGGYQGEGVWTLSSSELPGLQMSPVFLPQSFTLEVQGTSRANGLTGSSKPVDLLVTVNNVAPEVFVPPLPDDFSLKVGQEFQWQGFFTEPGFASWTATVDYGDQSGLSPLELRDDKTFLLHHVFQAESTYTVEVIILENGEERGSARIFVPIYPNKPSISDTEIARPDGLGKQIAIAVVPNLVARLEISGPLLDPPAILSVANYEGLNPLEFGPRIPSFSIQGQDGTSQQLQGRHFFDVRIANLPKNAPAVAVVQFVYNSLSLRPDGSGFYFYNGQTWQQVWDGTDRDRNGQFDDPLVAETLLDARGQPMRDSQGRFLKVITVTFNNLSKPEVWNLPETVFTVAVPAPPTPSTTPVTPTVAVSSLATLPAPVPTLSSGSPQLVIFLRASQGTELSSSRTQASFSDGGGSGGGAGDRQEERSPTDTIRQNFDLNWLFQMFDMSTTEPVGENPQNNEPESGTDTPTPPTRSPEPAPPANQIQENLLEENGGNSVEVNQVFVVPSIPWRAVQEFFELSKGSSLPNFGLAAATLLFVPATLVRGNTRGTTGRMVANKTNFPGGRRSRSP